MKNEYKSKVFKYTLKEEIVREEIFAEVSNSNGV